jgi:hypothetical protein
MDSTGPIRCTRHEEPVVQLRLLLDLEQAQELVSS